MLYVFFGKGGVRERALEHACSLAVGNGEVVKVSSDEYHEGVLTELAESTSLFGGVQVILIDTPSSDTEFEEGVERSLEDMQRSQNHFILIEGALLAPAKKMYTKYADSIEDLGGASGEKFNTFALTDAFLARDKKKLWMLLMDAWRAGESNEAIVGVLFWQVKILRLVSKTSSPEEAGQKPYTYNKAKQALQMFKEGEIERLSHELVQLYHDGHMGKGEMGTALERWVLGI